VTKNQSATRDVDARPMPRVIWMGFGIDDDGKERDDFPIRIVEVAPHHFIVETTYRDAMGYPSWQALPVEQTCVFRALIYRVASEYHGDSHNPCAPGAEKVCDGCGWRYDDGQCAEVKHVAGSPLYRDVNGVAHCSCFRRILEKPAESPCHDCRHSRNDGNGLICSLGLTMMTTSCLGWRNTPQKKIPCPRCRHATRTDRGLVCGVHMLQKCDEWAATVMVKGPSGDLLCPQFIERVLAPGCEETCKTCFYKTEKNHRDTCALGGVYMSLDDLGVVGCAYRKDEKK